VDESLRKALRNLDQADPATFLAAGRMLERFSANAETFSDLLEHLLGAYDAIFHREGNDFEIAWSLREQHRRCLHLTVMNGGLLHMYEGNDSQIYATLSENNFSYLLHLIVQHRRLSPPTSQFLQILQSSILENHAISCTPLSTSPQIFHEERQVRYLFDVVTKINPKKEWQPDYHLRFKFVRSVCRDLLEVSIEDNLYWGSPHEVQGMRLTGTSYTVYSGVEPEYDNDLEETTEDPNQPFFFYGHLSLSCR